MLNHLAQQYNKRIKAFSAGSAPSGRINPYALQALAKIGIDTSEYRSKSWDTFTEASAPKIDIVITVCDSAAAEQCPYWPNSPVKTHWGYPDPSNEAEENKSKAFELTRQAIAFKMMQLIQLPLSNMSQAELNTALSSIAQS
jgi:arsenate reductase